VTESLRAVGLVAIIAFTPEDRRANWLCAPRLAYPFLPCGFARARAIAIAGRVILKGLAGAIPLTLHSNVLLGRLARDVGNARYLSHKSEKPVRGATLDRLPRGFTLYISKSLSRVALRLTGSCGDGPILGRQEES
jgi:hypothetical protein